MAILGEPRLDEAAAAERIELLRRRTRDSTIASALVAAAAVAMLIVGADAFAFACLLGAAIGLAAAGLTRTDRLRLLTRLVAEGADGAHEEARAWAATLVTRPRRARLARGLERAAAAGRPGIHEYVHARPDRAAIVRADLLRLAGAFRDPGRPLAPRSAALCRRMLCEAIASPLYNPHLPEAELGELIRAIEAGLGDDD